MGKLTRAKMGIRTSLRGLSRQDYYRSVSMLNKLPSLLSRARKYVPATLWMRFDRSKPMSVDQINVVRDGLEAALFEMDQQDWPVCFPIATMRKLTSTRFANKFIWRIQKCGMARFPHISTPEGRAYTLPHFPNIKYNALDGPLAISTHVFDRLHERVPSLWEQAKRNPQTFWQVLKASFNEMTIIISPETHAPLFRLVGYGWIVLRWDSPLQMWIGVTFITPDMQGAPVTNHTDWLNHAIA